MGLKSTFYDDLDKEQRLSKLLDAYYTAHLKKYSFTRVGNLEDQLKGVDVLFQHKEKNICFKIDEKAQLDYLNEDLPTFAFELSYKKGGALKKGWLIDEKKTTDFYALVTAIYMDSGEYSSCKITLVNRKKLLDKLALLGFDITNDIGLPKDHGKHICKSLDPKTQGYLYLSSKNKREQPLNLVLRLDWLIGTKIAKRLV